MIDSLRKTLLAGLGAAEVTQEKVRAGLKDFVAQGKLSAAEAKAAAERIAAESRVEFEKARTQAGEKFREFVANADGEHLRRLQALEARVAALEAKAGKPAKARRAKA
jgi:polyhydroxyalkanoate synthesis regulator phasin